MLDVHTSTRVQSTLDTHAPRVRDSPAMHMLSHGNTRSRQKAWLPCSSHWPLADRRPARRWHIWRECALQCACHLRCSRDTCVVHTLCMPSTTDVVVLVRRDMMTMIETKTNDTMKKTENTMDDASECVSARTRTAHAHRRIRKPATSARGGPSPQHVLLKRPPLRSPYHALIASSRASRARSWQQMMRARIGIDNNKSCPSSTRLA